MGDNLTRRIARIIEEGRPIYGDPNEQARRILVLVLNPSGSASRANPMPTEEGQRPTPAARR